MRYTVCEVQSEVTHVWLLSDRAPSSSTWTTCLKGSSAPPTAAPCYPWPSSTCLTSWMTKLCCTTSWTPRWSTHGNPTGKHFRMMQQVKGLVGSLMYNPTGMFIYNTGKCSCTIQQACSCTIQQVNAHVQFNR